MYSFNKTPPITIWSPPTFLSSVQHAQTAIAVEGNPGSRGGGGGRGKYAPDPVSRWWYFILSSLHYLAPLIVPKSTFWVFNNSQNKQTNVKIIIWHPFLSEQFNVKPLFCDHILQHSPHCGIIGCLLSILPTWQDTLHLQGCLYEVE